MHRCRSSSPTSPALAAKALRLLIPAVELRAVQPVWQRRVSGVPWPWLSSVPCQFMPLNLSASFLAGHSGWKNFTPCGSLSRKSCLMVTAFRSSFDFSKTCHGKVRKASDEYSLASSTRYSSTVRLVTHALQLQSGEIPDLCHLLLGQVVVDGCELPSKSRRLPAHAPLPLSESSNSQSHVAMPEPHHVTSGEHAIFVHLWKRQFTGGDQIDEYLSVYPVNIRIGEWNVTM